MWRNRADGLKLNGARQAKECRCWTVPSTKSGSAWGEAKMSRKWGGEAREMIKYIQAKKRNC